ncbi:hypothetical protein BaRGS_00000622 [Batillaria attramentaria]|uniref:Uncharacterized protein n=1 Tax=Batillaria attramentaria TaxID=370345 RepID=A0ABD0MBF7_9CAEN
MPAMPSRIRGQCLSSVVSTLGDNSILLGATTSIANKYLAVPTPLPTKPRGQCKEQAIGTVDWCDNLCSSCVGSDFRHKSSALCRKVDAARLNRILVFKRGRRSFCVRFFSTCPNTGLQTLCEDDALNNTVFKEIKKKLLKI